jgi:hypothetical protein
MQRRLPVDGSGEARRPFSPARSSVCWSTPSRSSSGVEPGLHLLVEHPPAPPRGSLGLLSPGAVGRQVRSSSAGRRATANRAGGPDCSRRSGRGCHSARRAPDDSRAKRGTPSKPVTRKDTVLGGAEKVGLERRAARRADLDGSPWPSRARPTADAGSSSDAGSPSTGGRSRLSAPSGQPALRRRLRASDCRWTRRPRNPGRQSRRQRDGGRRRDLPAAGHPAPSCGHHGPSAVAAGRQTRSSVVEHPCWAGLRRFCGATASMTPPCRSPVQYPSGAHVGPRRRGGLGAPVSPIAEIGGHRPDVDVGRR